MLNKKKVAYDTVLTQYPVCEWFNEIFEPFCFVLFCLVLFPGRLCSKEKGTMGNLYLYCSSWPRWDAVHFHWAAEKHWNQVKFLILI